jgi:hypothetical protein
MVPGAQVAGNTGVLRRLMISRLSPYLLILLVCIPALVVRLDVYPPAWFDEGYRTNAARTLAVQGIYGTYSSDGVIPYDVGISTGPADIVPLAIAYRLVGAGVAQARLVDVLYALLGIATLYALAGRLFGRRAALFSLLFILAVPPIQGVSLLLVGRQIEGEMPALALISLGLLFWVIAGRQGHWNARIASGLFLGFGLLSKTQAAFGILPAFALIALLRARKERRLLAAMTPLLVALGILVGWMVWTGLSVPREISARNALMLSQAIRTQLLTGLWGRSLSLSAGLILILMLASVATALGLLIRRRSHPEFPTDRDWGMALLGLIVLLSGLWFGLLSIGWPRYATLGYLLSLLFVGRLALALVHAASRWIMRRHPAAGARLPSLANAGLAAIACLGSLIPIMRFRSDNSAQQAAAFISTAIPQSAVIESWAWELDALSNHWRFHHPDLSYLYKAERQEFIDHVPFALGYDPLQANPDYLISDPFSQWTRLYSPAVLETDFRRMAAFGDYVVYQRIR